MNAAGAAAGDANDLFVRLCLRSRWQPELLDNAGQLAGVVDWPRLSAAASAHGLAPLLYDILKGRALAPDDAIADLQAAYRETALNAGLMSVELHDVLNLLDGNGLPAVVLKGAALGDTLYGNSALRPMTDLDLLLHEADVVRAVELLTERGYRRASGEVWAGHAMQFENEIVLRSREPVPLAVELHWHLLDSPFYQERVNEGWFWRSAEVASVAETKALVLGLEATFLHLSAHYVLHHRGQGVRWIYDIAALLALVGSQMNWQEVLARSREFHLVFSVQEVVREMVNDWGLVLPEDLLAAVLGMPVSAEERRVVQWLQAEQRPVVQRFWADLASMPSWRRRLAYLLANLFPSPVYMQDRYALSGRAWVPLAYPYRWLVGVSGLVSSRRRSAAQLSSRE